MRGERGAKTYEFSAGILHAGGQKIVLSEAESMKSLTQGGTEIEWKRGSKINTVSGESRRIS